MPVVSAALERIAVVLGALEEASTYVLETTALEEVKVLVL